MDRVNRLLDNDKYISYIEKIEFMESERQFCRHGFEHGLSVARISYAYMLEKGDLIIAKDCVYAAGFLHDIGRWVEYQTGEDHAEASARLALPLLDECRYNVLEIEIILRAIREHRRHGEQGLTILGEALSLADEWARDCRNCSAQTQCYKFNQSMKQIVY
jgi:HD superfamily phosphodiesterase